MGKYDDMLNMKRHVSTSHTPMAAENRAAQFAPFAALSGYDEAVKETGRLTGERIELDENLKEVINSKLLMIQDCIDEHHTISVTYFVPDKYKSGGRYETVTSSVKKLNIIDRRLIMSDGTDIPMNEIIDITGEIFRYTEIQDI